MFRVFSGATADEVWREAATALLSGRQDVLVQPSRNGTTRELLRAAITIQDPRQRWVYSRYPVISPAFALAEVIWIMAGRNDAAILNYFNKRLAEYAGATPEYHGAYGYRLRRHFDGIDQLKRAYSTLKHQPNSRQVVLQIWDPRQDLPRKDGTPAAEDIPCNVLALLNIREGRLEWTQIIRSNDIFLGLPHNLVQFTFLHEIMAGWLEVDLGSYNQLSNSLHLYEEHYRPDLIYDGTRVLNTDYLNFSKDVSESSFSELAVNMDRIADPSTSVHDLLEMTAQSSLLPPFRNILSILCAEGARRRQGINTAQSLLKLCTNPALAHLAKRWMERWDSSSGENSLEENK